MKNNKILYILTLIITLFSFNTNVYAAQGLTCVYKAGWTNQSRKSILVQANSGTRTVYVNSNSNATIDSVGWGLKSGLIDISKVSAGKKDSNGDLLECPEYIETSNEGVQFVEKKTLESVWYEPLLPNESEKSVKQIYISITTPISTNGEHDMIIDSTSSQYTAYCKYRDMLENGEYHYIQLAYGREHIKITEYDPEKSAPNGVNYSGYASAKYYYSDGDIFYIYSLSIDENFTISNLLDTYKGVCPPSIMIERKEFIDNIEISTNVKLTGNGTTYHLMGNPENDGVLGSNPLNGEDLTIDQTHNIKIDFLKPEINNCADLLGEEIAGYLNTVWNIVKFGVPITLLGLGTVDFAQAVFAGKDDGMKKAQEKFIKRVIIAIAIFLVPTLITFLLKIANSIWGGFGTDLCGIIF